MTTSVPFGRRGVRQGPAQLDQPRRAPTGSPGDAGWSMGALATLLFSFDGRVRRLHYWLVSIGAQVALGVVMVLVNSLIAVIAGDAPAGAGVRLLVALVVEVVGCWIALAVEVKRWHDRDKSWPWLFIGFIPIVGWLWVLIECGFLDGTPGSNRFGPSPKG
jgi:uncharacterized membrane protein YhaH (DUF805 family)